MSFPQAVEKVSFLGSFFVGNRSGGSYTTKKRGDTAMLGKTENHRHDQVTVEVEDLVPADHFLRTIDAMIDCRFMDEQLAPYYSPTVVRPSIPPIALFKMMFIGYFYGIRSEQQLEKEIQTNVAYRWFLVLSLTDRIPDHSTNHAFNDRREEAIHRYVPINVKDHKSYQSQL